LVRIPTSSNHSFSKAGLDHRRCRESHDHNRQTGQENLCRPKRRFASTYVALL